MRVVKIAKKPGYEAKVHLVPLHCTATLCGYPTEPAQETVIESWDPGHAPVEPLDAATGCANCRESLWDLRTIPG